MCCFWEDTEDSEPMLSGRDEGILQRQLRQELRQKQDPRSPAPKYGSRHSRGNPHGSPEPRQGRTARPGLAIVDSDSDSCSNCPAGCFLTSF